jgi:hypothetical protein
MEIVPNTHGKVVATLVHQSVSQSQLPQDIFDIKVRWFTFEVLNMKQAPWMICLDVVCMPFTRHKPPAHKQEMV